MQFAKKQLAKVVWFSFKICASVCGRVRLVSFMYASQALKRTLAVSCMFLKP